MNIEPNIPGYDNYYATPCGRVFSIVNNKFLRPVPRRRGYVAVNLCQAGKRTKISIHRIIASVFIHKPNFKDVVNHKNGNIKDNRAANLEWVTQSENVKHSWDTGLRKRKMA